MKNIFFIVSVFGYYFAIQFGAINYLSSQTFSHGIFFDIDYNLNWAVLIGSFILVTIKFLPSKVEKASELFFFCQYIFVYLPAMSFIGTEANVRYIPLAVSFTLGVIVIGLTTTITRTNRPSMLKVPRQIMVAMLTVYSILFIVLLNKYYSILSIASFDSVYQQRELGAADTWYMGYVQTYFVFFFSAFIFGVGLFENKWLFVFFGASGFLLMYAITAERTTILFPIILKILHHNQSRLSRDLNLVRFFLFFSSVLIVLVSLLYESSLGVNELGFYYFTRPIATPGKFVLDYYNFFSDNGFTYFSHLKGFNLFLPIPEVYKSNPYWPMLGWIVGNDFHQITSNSNAAFVSADGLASMGVSGMFLMCLLFSIFLIYLDKLSQSIPMGLVITSVFPIAFSLTNGSLFSSLLSYGGFAFLILFYQLSKIENGE